MKLRVCPGGGFSIAQLSVSELHVLQAACGDADASAVPGAEERLYPPPVGPEDDDGINEDWEEYVVPSLYDRFSEDVTAYERDIGRARREGEGEAARYHIEVPADHVERWFSALNQARLVLNERHAFPQESDHRDWLAFAHDGRLEPFLRMRFYGLVQEWIVEHLMD